MKDSKTPPIDLSKIEVPVEALRLVSPDLMRKFSFVPVKYENNVLHIATSNVDDINAIDIIKGITCCEISVYSASKEAVWDTLKRSVPEFRNDVNEHELEIKEIDLPDKTDAEDSPGNKNAIIEAVDKLIKLAVSKRASDIHLEPQIDAFFLRFRIDGIMSTIHKFQKSVQVHLTSRIKILANMNITERRLPQDGQFSIEKEGRFIDFRVSTLPGKYGEKIVIRVLDKIGIELDLGHLGFPPVEQSTLETLIMKPQGMVLVTGPTGSGKTTTLYSILNKIRSPVKNVITLEDPVEYELLADKKDETGITQVQVNSKIGMDFTSALRAALRQDPDVIMVGEIRDKETAEIAMKASLTGHLVLSTLHTNDTFGTLLRLKDMGIEPYLITSTVTCILAQRLVRMLCPDCKQAYKLPSRVIKLLFPDETVELPAELTLFRPKGCDVCRNTGYRGRMGIYELLVMDDEVRLFMNTHLDHKSAGEFRKLRKNLSLRGSGLELVKKGFTTAEEVFRVTVE